MILKKLKGVYNQGGYGAEIVSDIIRIIEDLEGDELEQEIENQVNYLKGILNKNKSILSNAEKNTLQMIISMMS